MPTGRPKNEATLDEHMVVGMPLGDVLAGGVGQVVASHGSESRAGRRV